MHPDLLNNSIFLRYYNQWQQDPASIVFAPLADFLLGVGKTEEAIRICLEGLNHHPDFVSGRLVLAKAWIQKRDFARAKEIVNRILEKLPAQTRAKELLMLIAEKERAPVSTPPPSAVPHWETMTMAKIYAAQGHLTKAREVYQSILNREPQNEEARFQLAKLERGAD